MKRKKETLAKFSHVVIGYFHRILVLLLMCPQRAELSVRGNFKWKGECMLKQLQSKQKSDDNKVIEHKFLTFLSIPKVLFFLSHPL